MAQKLYVILARDPRGNQFEDTISARDRGQAQLLFEAKYNSKCRVYSIKEQR